jgi:hypothetical protein
VQLVQKLQQLVLQLALMMELNLSVHLHDVACFA